MAIQRQLHIIVSLTVEPGIKKVYRIPESPEYHPGLKMGLSHQGGQLALPESGETRPLWPRELPQQWASSTEPGLTPAQLLHKCHEGRIYGSAQLKGPLSLLMTQRSWASPRARHPILESNRKGVLSPGKSDSPTRTELTGITQVHQTSVHWHLC